MKQIARRITLETEDEDAQDEGEVEDDDIRKMRIKYLSGDYFPTQKENTMKP